MDSNLFLFLLPFPDLLAVLVFLIGRDLIEVAEQKGFLALWKEPESQREPMGEDPILFLTGQRENPACVAEREIRMPESMEAMAFLLVMPVIEIIVVEKTASH